MRTIKDCNVCVVGGAGFLGSHLVEHLVEDRACRVLVIDNLVAGRRRFIHPDAKFVHADITDSEDYLRKLFEEHAVDYVFNMAAFPYIPVSFARPLHVFEVNATGALKVINAAHAAGCKGILQISSAEIYGDAGGKAGLHKIKETDEVRPHSTYGVAKAAVDNYCQTAWRERQTPVIALRQFNCVGERDVTHPYVLVECIMQLRHGPRVRLGNNSFRDFMYAGDQARMATALLERGQPGEVYNLGSEGGIKIYELARLVGRLMGHPSITIEEDERRKRPWEIWSLLSDNSKIYEAVGARPQVTLEEAVQRTIDYFRETDYWLAW